MAERNTVPDPRGSVKHRAQYHMQVPCVARKVERNSVPDLVPNAYGHTVVLTGKKR